MTNPTRYSALVISALLIGCGGGDRVAFQPTEQNLRLQEVDEVWQMIDRNYVGPTFNPQDWSAVRQDYLSRTYPSDDALNDALREMVGLLEDPETRYFTPEEFSDLQRTGELVEARVPRLASPVVQHRTDVIDGVNVGYIRAARLDEGVSDKIAAAIADLDVQGVDGYLLDLRSNPGGGLDAAIDTAALWLEGGLIATVNSRRSMREAQTDGASLMTTQPLAVVVDGETINGSELLAAALQDRQRAIVVGTQTYGSNQVLTVRPLTTRESGIMLTTARWYPPSGQDIDGVGVQPDIIVEAGDRQQFGTATDPQLRAAAATLLPAQGE